MSTRLHRMLARAVRSPAFWVLWCLGLLTVAANTQHPESGRGGGTLVADDRPSLTEMNSDKALQREGTLISDARGKFQLAKDRVAFIDESNRTPIVCLENLMLQRVLSYVSEDENRRQRWLVTGKITEFEGANYLWIDRAVRAR